VEEITMEAKEPEFRERVVKMQEFCDRKPLRTFYCIYDPDYCHWMSQEPFDGLIWTKDVRCRQEFASRQEAKVELEAFLEWRREREQGAKDPLGDIPSERDAA
jgi:hypothetical protein